MEAPTFYEAEVSCLTIGWLPVVNATKYEVQIKGGPDTDWRTITSEFTSCLLRKKNLLPATTYQFRLRAQDSAGFGEWSAPTTDLQTLPEGTQQLEAPQLQSADGVSLTIKWEAVPDATGYEVQFREQSKPEWTTAIASISSTAMRKKNLEERKAYLWRVKPSAPEAVSTKWAFSRIGGPFQVPTVSSTCVQLFGTGESLVTNMGHSVPLNTLAGKVVAIYCSASWCPPCKQFTPQLAHFYNAVKNEGHGFEVVFVSMDRDRASWLGYLNTMPWIAVDYDDAQTRQAIPQRYNVQGIPRLIVFGATGQMLEENAVQTPLTWQTWGCWQQGKSAGQA
uniref:protein-disulfide reductase n=1 Tax=Eutreptiella gymnastica TaxID=73025 RepID=A0A7S1IM31_9EUGL